MGIFKANDTKLKVTGKRFDVCGIWENGEGVNGLEETKEEDGQFELWRFRRKYEQSE